MFMRIHYRLFLTLLAATGGVVLCMFLILQWSIDRGFLRYVNLMEQERLERMAEGLEQAWTEEGSWEFLTRDPAGWLHFFSMGPEGSGEPREMAYLLRRRPEPGRFPSEVMARRLEARILLLDADHSPLFGRGERQGRMIFRTLTASGRTIGYLGLLPRRELSDVHELRFVRQQKLAMALAAGAVLAVSALLSFPLARRLVRPLKRVTEGTHRLAAGEYGTRVTVSSCDEIGQLARDFNALARTLEENERARRQWIADISHELRTPLSVLRGEIEALQDGVRQPTPEALASLHGEVGRLSRLVEDLHQLALSDLGALTYRKERLDLVPLLEEALASLRPDFEEQGLDLALRADTPEAPVWGDPVRLRQLFDNLLENSLKYTGAPGKVEARLERSGDRVLVHVLDSPPGVPEEALGRLFERLYRVEESRSRASGGAGLGLAICASIVSGHEGTIAARPSSLGGLHVTVALPLAAEGGENR